MCLEPVIEIECVCHPQLWSLALDIVILLDPVKMMSQPESIFHQCYKVYLRETYTWSLTIVDWSLNWKSVQVV